MESIMRIGRSATPLSIRSGYGNRSASQDVPLTPNFTDSPQEGVHGEGHLERGNKWNEQRDSDDNDDVMKKPT
jgi:hypothetical protein